MELYRLRDQSKADQRQPPTNTRTSEHSSEQEEESKQTSEKANKRKHRKKHSTPAVALCLIPRRQSFLPPLFVDRCFVDRSQIPLSLSLSHINQSLLVVNQKNTNVDLPSLKTRAISVLLVASPLVIAPCWGSRDARSTAVWGKTTVSSIDTIRPFDSTNLQRSLDLSPHRLFERSRNGWCSSAPRRRRSS